MIHGYGGIFFITYCKDINKFTDRFIHNLLKIIVYNCMLVPRITAFGSRLEMEPGAFNDLRVAC